MREIPSTILLSNLVRDVGTCQVVQESSQFQQHFQQSSWQHACVWFLVFFNFLLLYASNNFATKHERSPQRTRTVVKRKFARSSCRLAKKISANVENRRRLPLERFGRLLLTQRKTTTIFVSAVEKQRGLFLMNSGRDQNEGRTRGRGSFETNLAAIWKRIQQAKCCLVSNFLLRNVVVKPYGYTVTTQPSELTRRKGRWRSFRIESRSIVRERDPSRERERERRKNERGREKNEEQQAAANKPTWPGLLSILISLNWRFHRRCDIHELWYNNVREKNA